MNEKKHKQEPTTVADRGSIASMLLFIGWSAFVITILVAPGEKGTSSYRQSHGGLLGINIIVFLLLFLNRRDLPNMFRAARRVLRRPFSSTLHDYDEFFFTACIIGAIITTIFVLDFGAASSAAVKSVLVIFIISLKVAFDRWRASNRKR